ncbi:sigma-70 family RNA polymerase sigma factor [Fredinandcohnia humi]
MDEQLIGTARENTNEFILNQLVDLYGDDLKRIAFLYVNDLAQCEDIIQEVFISCYKHLSSFRHESQYKTWLIRITINKCKDYQRKWSFRNLIYKPLMEPFIKTSHESTEKLYERSVGKNDVAQAISMLPAIYKDILILYYYQELTMEEISQVTKSKVNTVKSRLSRGRQYLKEILEREGTEHGSI